MASKNTPRQVNVTSPDSGRVVLELSGSWTIHGGLQHFESIKPQIEQISEFKKIDFDTQGLETWDSSLLTFLKECQSYCDTHGIEFGSKSLPRGVQKLLDLSAKTPVHEDVSHKDLSHNVFAQAGRLCLRFFDDVLDFFAFIGESILSFGRVIRGTGQVRWRDFFYTLQQVGVEALPIVSLISFLVGVIMAFVGGVQLQKFGATIFVADLVGLAMVREMGAMMTGIIMCGRTGAAFAATIGTMKVNEEIDALTTTGISPMDFVVTPRIIALSLMMPLLVLFSDFVGILGGLIIGITMMDISFAEYYRQTENAVGLDDLSVGLIKGVAFGILIAVSGCLRGMQTGGSASAVGIAATSAVVTGITTLIISDAIFAFVFDALGM